MTGYPLVPPYRGLPTKEAGGCIDEQLYRSTVQSQARNNPHRCAEPPERGHEEWKKFERFAKIYCVSIQYDVLTDCRTP